MPSPNLLPYPKLLLKFYHFINCYYVAWKVSYLVFIYLHSASWSSLMDKVPSLVAELEMGWWMVINQLSHKKIWFPFKFQREIDLQNTIIASPNQPKETFSIIRWCTNFLIFWCLQTKYGSFTHKQSYKVKSLGPLWFTTFFSSCEMGLKVLSYLLHMW